MAMNYTEDQTIIDLFEQQVAKTPNNIALVFEKNQLTYQQLNAKANQLAFYLIGLKNSSESILLSHKPLIGITVERSLEMVIGLLAILKTGGAYVPIDPDYPITRIHYMLNDCSTPLLLTQSHLRAALLLDERENDCVVICLDKVNYSGLPTENPKVNLQAEDLAYVIYTSGSTGKPKGCLVTHQNVSRLLSTTNQYYQFNEKDIWTLFHSYAFDFSVWEIWGALLSGGQLVVVSYYTSRNPEAFYQLLIEQNVTVLNQTPTAFKQLINVDKQPDKLCLRLVIFGGEALDFSSLQPWFSVHGDQQPLLANMYGITETTVHVTYFPITNQQNQNQSLIGTALADLHVWVVDENLRPVPAGVPGEMLVGGAGVSRGYLNRPELTAEKFIEVRLSNKIERVYRTGDRARWLPDGNLEFLGRLDHQIKLRGFRIEPGEIETVLKQYSGVSDVIVTVREDHPGEKRLVAYLTLFKDEQFKVNELRLFLKEQLPEYMIPAAFVILDQFPQTANAKIDRNALPLPDQTRPDLEQNYIESISPIEDSLTGIWKDILCLDKIGINDNFFDLGGNSLLAMRIIVQMCHQFNIHFPINILFETQTIAALAAQVESMLKQTDNQIDFKIPTLSRNHDHNN